jgi:drug/metabolite transporter (DMT)-like permease
MLWLFITISAYFFGALANVGDKFLLGSKRISSAPVYAFYMGLFSLGSFILAPFGMTFPSENIFWLSIISGIFFLVGIMLLYFAIERAEASRVVPVIGAVIPLISFALAAMFGIESLSSQEVVGVSVLIFGGLLISFDLPLRLGRRKFFSGFYFALFAGVMMAIAYLMFKIISQQESFINYYIWTRFGIFVGALFLFFAPKWRKAILKSFFSARSDHKKAIKTSGIFIGNKLIGGFSTLMLAFAIKLGSVTLTNALVSLQYIFVLLLVGVFLRKHRNIFQEELEFWDWAQKIAAIVIIAVGVMLISK